MSNYTLHAMLCTPIRHDSAGLHLPQVHGSWCHVILRAVCAALGHRWSDPDPFGDVLSYGEMAAASSRKDAEKVRLLKAHDFTEVRLFTQRLFKPVCGT